MTTPASRRAARLAGLAAIVVLAGACGGGDRAPGATSPSPPPAGTEARAAGGEARPSPRAAVEALLAAEQANDHRASYRLLTAAARKELTAPTWARRRSEVPAVTGFTVERAEGSTVVVLVEHEPGLDPFVGLRPARERQTWRARREAGGWRVEPQPEVRPIYPSPDLAPDAALQWARAVQACDKGMARSRQALDMLFGASDAPAALCRTTAGVAAGKAERLPAGPASQELMAQYGPEALDWARTVAITGGPRTFHVVLAPIGSVWSVVGVFEP